MKDRGVESDEDVGLGLDFEEDEDEFRKCIEDDVVPGTVSRHDGTGCALEERRLARRFLLALLRISCPACCRRWSASGSRRCK